MLTIIDQERIKAHMARGWKVPDSLVLLLWDAYEQQQAELATLRALATATRSTVGAAVHELEASDFTDGTIRVPRRQAEVYKRAAADLTWVRVELRGLLHEFESLEPPQ